MHYIIAYCDPLVQEFQRKLADARRILVIGNGGIAIELVYVTMGARLRYVQLFVHSTGYKS